MRVEIEASRKILIYAGILYLFGMLVGILSVVPSVDSFDYLTKASENSNQVILGAFSQFCMMVSHLGIAILLYSIIKKYSKRLAFGYLMFKIITAVFIVIGVILLLMILSLSQGFVKAGSPPLSDFQTIGEMLQIGRDFVNHVAMIFAWSIGGILFYMIMLQSKLIPRWLASWGIIGAILAIIASLLLLFKLIDIITPTYIIINMPMAVQELVLAIWFIFKGFDSGISVK